jgi:hypothetical protein
MAAINAAFTLIVGVASCVFHHIYDFANLRRVVASEL